MFRHELNKRWVIKRNFCPHFRGELVSWWSEGRGRKIDLATNDKKATTRLVQCIQRIEQNNPYSTRSIDSNTVPQYGTPIFQTRGLDFWGPKYLPSSNIGQTGSALQVWTYHDGQKQMWKYDYSKKIEIVFFEVSKLATSLLWITFTHSPWIIKNA